MYDGVPMTIPVFVSAVPGCSASLEIPKSSTSNAPARGIAHEEDASRLHVAVNDALHVRRRERADDLPDDADRRADRHLADLAEVNRELLSLQVFPHDEGAPVGRATDVVDVDDERAPHGRRGLGLALEAREHVGLTQVLGVQHLDGESLAAQANVARLVDAADAPPSPMTRTTS